MVEKIIEYYEQDILQNKEWNKINRRIFIISILIIFFVSWLNQKVKYISLIVQMILMLLFFIMVVMITRNVVKKVIDKNNLKINSKIINIVAWRREFKETFRTRKIEQIKLKLQQERINKEGKKLLLDSLYMRYNEVCSNKNVFVIIFSFIATTAVTWVKLNEVDGSFVIEGVSEFINIIVVSGIILYSLNKVIDEVFLHSRDKKQNLKSLISIVEEIYMVKD